jgi:hypothetical protein
MKNFLSHVVSETLKINSDISNISFVLPNQRAGLYLKKQLKDQLNGTVFLPEISTFDNLVEKITGIQKIPSIELLFEFYEVYRTITSSDKSDSFEVFSHWAKIVLDDFNEIDNQLVNPQPIFGTLHEINILQNWDPNTEITRNYLAFIQNLETYYMALYTHLRENQKAYQGMLFREAVEVLQHFVQNTPHKYVFVGFNYLKKAESVIIQELLEAKKAEIYWDIPHYFNQLYQNKNNAFDTYAKDWNYYKTHDFLWNFTEKLAIETITLVGVSKKVGMMKYAGNLLKNETNIQDTALVLHDQNILATALQSIPENVESINITMGIPLNSFSFSGLIQHFFELHIQQTQTQKGFYHKTVLKILQHPIMAALNQDIKEIVKVLIAQNKVYFQTSDFEIAFQFLPKSFQNILTKTFTPLKNNETIPFLNLINDFITTIKPYLKGLELEVLFKHYQLNQQLILLLSKHPFIEQLKSLLILHKKLMFSENLNFIGKPLQGMQLMGFLETQTLDFNHLILIGTNEGMIPNNKKKESFIPIDVRKHYDLPTHHEDEMIMTYLFYRAIQHSKKTTILYNTDSDTFGGGEKSRFITKLLLEYPQIKHIIADAVIPIEPIKPLSVEKTVEIIEKMKEIFQKGISPSALTTYLYNPIEFYKQRILKINNLEEIEETIAENTMGTVVHGALEDIYKPFLAQFLVADTLEKVIPTIRHQVHSNFQKSYPNGNLEEGKNKLIFEVAANFVLRFIRNEINMLQKGHQIKIIALEYELTEKYLFKTFSFPITFHGYVDRLDEIDGMLRIVDYKTGKVEASQMRINDFSNKINDYKYSKALQVMLYANMVAKSLKCNDTKPIQAGIISFKNLKSGFLPINFADKGEDFEINEMRQVEFLSVVESLLTEILNPEIAFLEKEV